MTKIPFNQYTPRTHGLRDIDESISEIQREMDVRKRLFDKWVQDGRMSWTDANDRLQRIMSALKHLIAYAQRLEKEATLQDNPTSEAPTDISPFPLDGESTEAVA